MLPSQKTIHLTKNCYRYYSSTICAYATRLLSSKYTLDALLKLLSRDLLRGRPFTGRLGVINNYETDC